MKFLSYRLAIVLMVIALGAWWGLSSFARSIGLSSATALLGGWKPRIGDPTAFGWAAVCAYAITASLCWSCFLRVRSSKKARPRRKDTILWLALSLLFTFLCVNKQLDLQSLFTSTARVIARAQRWYSLRGIVQAWFIYSMVAIGATVMISTLFLTWKRVRDYSWVLVGTAFLVTFIVVRAASFHHVDRLIGYQLSGLKMNWILELGGIACVAFGAMRFRQRGL